MERNVLVSVVIWKRNSILMEITATNRDSVFTVPTVTVPDDDYLQRHCIEQVMMKTNTKIRDVVIIYPGTQSDELVLQSHYDKMLDCRAVSIPGVTYDRIYARTALRMLKNNRGTTAPVTKAEAYLEMFK